MDCTKYPIMSPNSSIILFQRQQVKNVYSIIEVKSLKFGDERQGFPCRLKKLLTTERGLYLSAL